MITACLILNMGSLPVFAAHTDGHTNVTARIEAVSDETEATDSGDVIVDEESDEVSDSQPAQIDDNSRRKLWIALIFISGCGGYGVVLYIRKKRNL